MWTMRILCFATLLSLQQYFNVQHYLVAFYYYTAFTYSKHFLLVRIHVYSCYWEFPNIFVIVDLVSFYSILLVFRMA